MLIFSLASPSLLWTSHLHQQDLGDRGKMLLLPLQVAPKCLTQHSIHPAAVLTWRLVLQSEFESFSSTTGLEAMGWRDWKEGSKQDTMVCPKTRGQCVTRVPGPHPQHLGTHLPTGSQHPSHSCFPYLVLRSSDPVRFPRSCHGDEM